MTQTPTSLVDLLRQRALEQPNKWVYRFLLDGEQEEQLLSYAELDRQVRSLAALLQTNTKPGDRALLLYAPGIDFIVAFWACLYAKVIAVPAYPPHPLRLEKTLPTVLRIIGDAQPTVALMATSLLTAIVAKEEVRGKLGTLKLIATDQTDTGDWSAEWQDTGSAPEDLAFLQYTSGSTSTPKGVILSHCNLLHNMELIQQCFGAGENTQGVLWLPPYHDMGLIGGILQPVFSGAWATLMPPLFFLQRPLRWLEAISRYKGAINGAPNFAYDLCLRKIKPEQRDLLDLSHWKVAFNGAEPVYHKTLYEFAAYFAPCGFHPEAFLPCYGVAEATLLVSGGPKESRPTRLHLLSKGLEANQVILSATPSTDTRTLVSCGHLLPYQQVRVVNPDSLLPCAEQEIGEIWLRGPCVARGYWQKPEETQLAFGAQLANGTAETYLRTGDLGFLKDGELYITGRIKNLIICAGKNHYAHDLERSAEDAHPAILPAGCAAFSIPGEGLERVVMVVEVNPKLLEQADDLIKTIRDLIAQQHGLQLDDVLLTGPGSIPKTTSGKTRHFLCRQHYLDGTLKKLSSI